MNWKQWLASKLLGWQYVIFMQEMNKPEVHRARLVGGVYRIKDSSISTFFLTKETMAPSTAELQVFMAAHRHAQFTGQQIHPLWRWAGITKEVVAHTCMLPDEDDFRPTLTADTNAATAAP